MKVTLRLGSPLRDAAGGKADLKAEAAGVMELLEKAVSDYPGLREKLFDAGGGIKQHWKIYKNGDDIEGLDGMRTALEDGDLVAILSAVEGG